MDFEWDPNKARINKAKHDVTFEEATEVFADRHSSTVADPDHSDYEERFLIFGRTRQGRSIVVAFTDRSDRMRLISARQMTRRERQAYEQ